MDTGRYAEVEIAIAAEAEAVWNGLTDPGIVRRYFMGTDLSADWKIGGKIFFRGTYEGKAYEDKGTIVAYDPPHMLSYTYWSNLSGAPDAPENYRTIRYELAKAHGGTTLTVIQDGVASEEERVQSEQNWRMIFEGLKDILEQTPSSAP